MIDPDTEQAVLRRPGSATVAQLEQLLDDGERAVRGNRPVQLAEPARNGAADGDAPPAAVIARANRLAAQLQTSDAVSAYRTALPGLAPAARTPVVESLVLALLAARDHAACARTAASEAPSLVRGPAFANVVASGLYCAEAASRDEPGRAATLASLEALAREALELPGLLADDRAGLFELVAEARAQAGDAAGERAVAARWLAFVEEEAARAPTAEARASFDPQRVAAAIKAGDPGRAIPALLRSEHDLPADYNPPARLAQLYQSLRRFDEALAAIDRALVVYGPRRIRLLENKASIQEDRGDRDAARATLKQALAAASALPPAQRRDETVARIAGRLR